MYFPSFLRDSLDRSGYVIGAGVHLCIYVTQESLNFTLAVDSPFQTLVVDFSSNLWTSSTICSRNYCPH